METKMIFKALFLLLIASSVGSINITENPDGCPRELWKAANSSGVNPVLERHETAMLMLLGFGGFSIILACLYNGVRKYVFHDEHNLDTTFDAGGNVSLSLTAVTVASQLFWPGDILHSATLTVKNGIAGPFWYAVGIMINIFIFPLLSVQFKTRAPGAKTYLQIIYARFGKHAHMVFCCFALLTNIVITIGLLLAGRATIQSLTIGCSDEFALIIMATLFGSYSLIGGLGTTFYVSYFNACLVFVLLIVFVVKILHSPKGDNHTIGHVENMYEAISCVKGPEDNYDNSYLTFRSGGALLYGFIEIFVSSAVTFCDQASWQSRIAAKPIQGVWGFLLAGFIWFSIPSVMASTTGLAYLALSAENQTHLLSTGEVTEGLVTPLIAEKVLGAAGGILVLTMGSMALMSTGSGEVMAISSIIVYDIYQKYIKPFRRSLTANHCVLCGELKKMDTDDFMVNDHNGTMYCHCISVGDCEDCNKDLEARRQQSAYGVKPFYHCPTHGRYRQYQDNLIGFKNWCIMWVTIGLVPFGLVIFASGIDLNWIFYAGAIVTIPCFPPVFLSILWVKATAQGLVAGGISGLFCGISATLAMASTYKHGLNNFLINTVEDYTILAGTCTSFGVSISVCIIVSILTHKIKCKDSENKEWQKMYDIDNPLNPWEINYREDFKSYELHGRPTFEQMSKAFRRAKITAYIGASIAIGLFALIIPGIMASFPVLTLPEFSIWVTFTQVWAVVMAVIVIFAPPFEEFRRIYRQLKLNKDKSNRGKNVHLLECKSSVAKDTNCLMSNEPVSRV